MAILETTAWNARAPTLVVAANDAPSKMKAGADYVCDGTADDSEIQAAIDTGNPVQLTEGGFSLNASLNVNADNLVFRGAGKLLTDINAKDAGTPVMVIGAASDGAAAKDHITVGGFTADMPGTGTVAAIRMWGLRYFHMSDVFTDQGLYGLEIRKASRYHLEDVNIFRPYSAGAGIRFLEGAGAASGNGQFDNCQVVLADGLAVKAVSVEVISGDTEDEIDPVIFHNCVFNGQNFASTIAFDFVGGVHQWAMNGGSCTGMKTSWVNASALDTDTHLQMTFRDVNFWQATTGQMADGFHLGVSGESHRPYLVLDNCRYNGAVDVCYFTDGAPYVRMVNGAWMTNCTNVVNVDSGVTGNLDVEPLWTTTASPVVVTGAGTCHVNVNDEHGEWAASDPGDGNAIPNYFLKSRVPLVSGAANGGETRSLADATRAGQTLDLYFKTDGGKDIAITAASDINQNGDNVMTFSDVGEHIQLVSIEDGADYEWRVVANDGVALA